MRQKLALLWVTGFVLFCTLSTSSTALAIENLGPECEFILRLTPINEISSTVSVPLNDNDVLVRGNLEPFHEQGMEDRIAFSIFDEFFEQKVVRSAYDALFPLVEGDRLFILDEAGEVAITGYYRENLVPVEYTFGGKTYQSVRNVPALYQDPEFTRSAVDQGVLNQAFSKNAKAVMVRRLDPDVKKKWIATWAPILRQHFIHQMSAMRFLTINAKTHIEIAYFETVLMGRFSFQLDEPSKTVFDPSTNTISKGPVAQAIAPFVTVDGEDSPRSLTFGDRVILLDKSSNVIFDGFIQVVSAYRGLIVEEGRRNLSTAEFLDLASRAVRIVVIRRFQ